MDVPILKGSRVVLRPLVADDAAALAAAGSEDRATFGLTTVPADLASALAYIDGAEAMRLTGWRLPFVIEFDGRVVGSTSYIEPNVWSWPAGSPHQRDGVPDVCEIGATWLAASAQRTSCNTECKLLLLAHAFETWEVHRVSLRTDARNQRSRAAIERLGCQFDGVRRADLPGTDDTVRDSAYYSMLAAEWPAAKAALTTRLQAV